MFYCARLVALLLSAHSAKRCFLPPVCSRVLPKRGPLAAEFRAPETSNRSIVGALGLHRNTVVVCHLPTWFEARRHVNPRLRRQHVCPLHDLTYRNLSCSGLTSAPASRYCFCRQSAKSETRVSVQLLEHLWRQPATTGSSSHSLCLQSNGHGWI